MLLASGPFSEFMQFIQVFFWITIPFLLLGILATVLLHYRKKKRGNVEDELPLLLPAGLPAGYSPVPSEYVVTASLQQIDEFRKRLTLSNAKFTLLKKDYDALGEKYNALVSPANTPEPDQNIMPMDNQTNNSRINEQEYLRDVLTEKKKQIEFLQIQIEQRIRDNHELETRFNDLSADYMGMKNVNEDLQRNLQAYEEELKAKQAKKEELISMVDLLQQDKQSLLAELHESKSQANQLQILVEELKGENDQLNTQLDEKETAITRLEEQVAIYADRINKLNAKLDVNRKIMLHVRNEIGMAVEGELPENYSPVITMKTDFRGTGNENLNEAAQ